MRSSAGAAGSSETLRGWMHTWSAPASQWAWMRARIADSSPQTTMASIRRSDPPFATSSGVKPRVNQLFA